jgi:hypothetical protein
MIAAFHLFKRQSGGRVRWLGAAVDMEDAKERLQDLAISSPGEYFIYVPTTGQRLFIQRTEAERAEIDAPPKTQIMKNELMTGENMHGNNGSGLRPVS